MCRFEVLFEPALLVYYSSTWVVKNFFYFSKNLLLVFLPGAKFRKIKSRKNRTALWQNQLFNAGTLSLHIAGSGT